MQKYLLIIMMSYLSTQSVALASARKTEGKVHTEIRKDQLLVRADSGFHLNADAPASLNLADGKKIKPNTETKEFIFKLPNSSGEANLEVYACDDQNTVCEPHRLLVIWGNHKEKSSSPEGDLFIKNNYEQALAEAKKTNKLVFIEFGARWCPPCIRLEHEVFNTPEFKALNKSYVFLNIDVDLESHYELMNKYSVKAFPSLVVVNSSGAELARFLDFQEKSFLIGSLKNLSQSKKLDVDTLMMQSKTGDPKALLALAEYYNKSLQLEEAVSAYEKSLGLRYFEAKVAFLEENSEGNGKIIYEAALESAIKNFPDSFQSLNWRFALARSIGKKSEVGTKLLQETLIALQKWIDHPEFIAQAHKEGFLLELKDLVLPEIYALQAEVYQELGEGQKSKDSYGKAVTQTLKLQPGIHNPTVVIYLVAYMKPVKTLEEIEPWLEKLESAYPNEFTYPQRHAKLLYDNKKYDKALSFAQKSHDLSYGNNKFTSGLLLAQIKNELQQKEEAKTQLKNLLSSPESQSPRNKRVVKNIQDFLKKL